MFNTDTDKAFKDAVLRFDTAMHNFNHTETPDEVEYWNAEITAAKLQVDMIIKSYKKGGK